MWHGLMTFAVQCAPRTFFGIQSWDKYLYSSSGGTTDYIRPSANGEFCEYAFSFFTGTGADRQLDLTVFSLIGLGVLDILLRLGAMVAVGFVVYGGIQYVLSQGEPDKAKKALGTIINALVGLAITILAASVVAFIGNRVGG